MDALTDLLAGAVDSGASVSFMQSTTRDELAAFWTRIAGEVRAPRRCRQAAGPPRGAGSGIGRALMTELQAVARDTRRTLLVLDTVTGSVAERLHTNLGWARVGVIPDYALFPDGRPGATTVFFKQRP